ncbi:hypothetical protein [Ponticaulis profundi]|uniref:Uncharacterized protein n=1 Tax=Ponticaulis profundi TaxID=2665222 RepID=A0ABW1SE91_9PROT
MPRNAGVGGCVLKQGGYGKREGVIACCIKGGRLGSASMTLDANTLILV